MTGSHSISCCCASKATQDSCIMPKMCVRTHVCMSDCACAWCECLCVCVCVCSCMCVCMAWGWVHAWSSAHEQCPPPCSPTVPLPPPLLHPRPFPVPAPPHPPSSRRRDVIEGWARERRLFLQDSSCFLEESDTCNQAKALLAEERWGGWGGQAADATASSPHHTTPHRIAPHRTAPHRAAHHTTPHHHTPPHHTTAFHPTTHPLPSPLTLIPDPHLT